MSKLIKNVSIVLVGLFFAFALVEIILRIVNVFPLLDNFLLEDPVLVYKFKADLKATLANADGIVHKVETKSLGFDDIGFRDDGINGEPYAVVLGDSFTLASEVNMEDGWVERLENKLNKDVVNMALYGYGAIQEKLMLENYGIKLKPKLVIWGFFVNDFSDDFEVNKSFTNTKTLLQRMYRELQTVRLIWISLSKLQRLTDSITYKDSSLNYIFWPNQWRYIYPVTPDSEAVKVGEKITKENILSAKEIADKNDAEFLMIILPTKDQVHWELIKGRTKGITLEELGYPVDSIRQFCSENEIKCLDLTPDLIVQASSGEQLYFPIDGHFNENGNAVIADLIHKFLIENNLSDIK